MSEKKEENPQLIINGETMKIIPGSLKVIVSEK